MATLPLALEKVALQGNPLPQWSGLSVADLARNSERAALSLIMGHSLGTVGSEGLLSILEGETSPHIHTAGRSGARVANVEPSGHILPTSTGQVIYMPFAPERVLKQNPTSAMEAFEFSLYRALRERGLPVPQVTLTESGLVVEHLGQSLDRWIFERAKEEPYHRDIQELLTKMAQLISQFDATLPKVLSEEERRGAMNRIVSPLAAKFGISQETAQERWYALRMAEALPPNLGGFMEFLDPIEKALTQGREQYGCWTTELSPRNAFPCYTGADMEKPHLKVADFNRVKRAIMQEADALALDAFLPVQGLGTDGPLYIDGRCATSLDESDRTYLVQERLKAWEQETGQTINRGDYQKLEPAARFLVNVREARCMLEESARARNFLEVVLKGEGLGHHTRLACDALLAFGRQQGQQEEYLRGAKRLYDCFAETYQSIVPEEVIRAAREWSIS
ncbi:MAG: hypothetical protein AABX70_07095 [Nanoarchaeota archaeon]|mgnify:CR=1 FL=1